MTGTRETAPVYLDALAGAGGMQEPASSARVVRIYPDATAATTIVSKAPARSGGGQIAHRPASHRPVFPEAAPVQPLPVVDLPPVTLVPPVTPNRPSPTGYDRLPQPAPTGYPAPVAPLDSSPALQWLIQQGQVLQEAVTSGIPPTQLPRILSQGLATPPARPELARPAAPQQRQYRPQRAAGQQPGRSHAPKKGSGFLTLLFIAVIVLAFSDLGDQFFEWLKTVIEDLGK